MNDPNFNYSYQTETFNLLESKYKFKKKIIDKKNNRWLKFIDAAYVIGLGNNWVNFKKNAIFQDLEDITHYIEAAKLKDINQYFYLGNNKNLVGCHMSHVICCEDAIKNNYKNIIIMEDDCSFTKYITNDEIDKLIYLKNKYNASYINLSPIPSSYYLFSACNQLEIDLIQKPTNTTHFIFLNINAMKTIIKTKYEKPSKHLRLSGSSCGYIDRDWFGADDFWRSFTNSYALVVKDKNIWAIQEDNDDTRPNRGINVK